MHRFWIAVYQADQNAVNNACEWIDVLYVLTNIFNEIEPMNPNLASK